MKKLLIIVALLPVLASAQGLQPEQRLPGPIQSPWTPGFQWFGGDPVSYTAKLAGAGCLASGAYLSPKTSLTATRADVQWVDASNRNQTTPGLIAEDAGTVAHVVFSPNWALYSSSITSGASYTAAWTGPNVTLATGPETSPDGSQWSKLTSTTNNARAVQSIVMPSTSVFTAAVTLRKDTGVGVAGVTTDCTTGLTPVCSCALSDGTACSATSSGTACTVRLGALTTTPVRLSVTTTCSVPITIPAFYLSPGDYGGATGTSWFSMVQVAPGASLGPYATTTTAPNGLIDTKSNVWAQNGTVPQNPATWNAPPSAGPYGNATNYSLGTGVDVGDFAGDWTVCEVINLTSVPGAQQITLSDGLANTAGWYFDVNGGAPVQASLIQSTSGSISVLSADGLSLKPNIVCGGRASGTLYLKANGGATTSAAAVANTPGTAQPLRIGSYSDGTKWFAAGSVLEVYATTTPWNEAAVTALQQSVLSKINQPILNSCAANTLAVDSTGAEVWGVRTNLLLRSQDFSTTWSANNGATYVVDTTLAPDGTLTADTLSSGAISTPLFVQAFTATAVPHTYSIWLQGGTTSTTVLGLYNAGWPNFTAQTLSGSCSIAASGSAVPASITGLVAGQWCRVAYTATLTAASWGAYLYPETNGAGTTKTVAAWGAQVEAAAYPGPYIPTVAATVSRAYTAASIPLPALHTTNTYCIGLTLAPGFNWNDNSLRYPFSNFDGSNGFDLVQMQMTGGTAIGWSVYDAASGTKSWNYTHGFGAVRTPHRFVICGAAGTMSMYVDGVAVGSGSGTGTGLLGQTRQPLALGRQTPSVGVFDGAITNVKIYPNQTYRAGM